MTSQAAPSDVTQAAPSDVTQAAPSDVTAATRLLLLLMLQSDAVFDAVTGVAEGSSARRVVEALVEGADEVSAKEDDCVSRQL